MKGLPSLVDRQAERYATQKPGRGQTVKAVKAKKDRGDAKKLRAFRDAVWGREQLRWFMASGSMVARCQRCEVAVYRDIEPFGEVHHKIPRSTCTPEERYDPSNGVLLCGHMQNDCHGRVQRHEISV